MTNRAMLDSESRSPVVTIALPIYNSARFLERTIRSIQAQSFEDFEVIAVLDGCTDASGEILRRCLDSRFQIIEKPVNEGLIRALNDIHRNARGRYVARFDQDDLYHPERLALQVCYLEDHPHVDVLGTRFDYIDSDDKFLRSARPFPLTHERIKRDFQRYTAIGGPTCMYRLARIRAVGDYDERYCYLEDVSLWLKCLAAGYRFANLPQVLVHYRLHDDQTNKAWGSKQIPQLAEAYAQYGVAIWGRAARPYGTREPRIARWKRKFEDRFFPER